MHGHIYTIPLFTYTDNPARKNNPVKSHSDHGIRLSLRTKDCVCSQPSLLLYNLFLLLFYEVLCNYFLDIFFEGLRFLLAEPSEFYCHPG